MKKSLVIALSALFALNVAAGTSFAASNITNPYVDVPPQHWAYDAVRKLAEAGIVDGYGDQTFRGDRTITRYEMAELVARAMTKIDQADAQNRQRISKLQVEFQKELTKMGIRLNKLERSLDNVKWTGEIRMRYANDKLTSHDGSEMKNNLTEARTRLETEAKIGKEWKFLSRLENTLDFRQSGDNGNITLDHAYLQGNVGIGTVTAGRIPYVPAYGLIADSKYNGVGFGFGNKLKANIFYGKESKSHRMADGAEYFPVSSDVLDKKGENTDLVGAELLYPIDKKTNFKAAYLTFEADKLVDTSKAKMWEVGMDNRINDNLAVKAVYGKSNANDNNKAYVVGLTYKDFNREKANSFNIYGNYLDIEKLATFNSTYGVDSIGNIVANNDIHGSKGYEVGVNYVLAKNILLHTNYTRVKANDETDWKDKNFKAQVFVFF